MRARGLRPKILGVDPRDQFEAQTHPASPLPRSSAEH
jgi:hypothetical protein